MATLEEYKRISELNRKNVTFHCRTCGEQMTPGRPCPKDWRHLLIPYRRGYTPYPGEPGYDPTCLR